MRVPHVEGGEHLGARGPPVRGRGFQQGVALPEDAVIVGPHPREARGPRAMPGLVPANPDDPEAQPNRDAWDVLRAWDKPFLVAFSDKDPITGGMAPVFKQAIPGAKGIGHPTICRLYKSRWV